MHRAQFVLIRIVCFVEAGRKRLGDPRLREDVHDDRRCRHPRATIEGLVDVVIGCDADALRGHDVVERQMAILRLLEVGMRYEVHRGQPDVVDGRPLFWLGWSPEAQLTTEVDDVTVDTALDDGVLGLHGGGVKSLRAFVVDPCDRIERGEQRRCESAYAIASLGQRIGRRTLCDVLRDGARLCDSLTFHGRAASRDR